MSKKCKKCGSRYGVSLGDICDNCKLDNISKGLTLLQEENTKLKQELKSLKDKQGKEEELEDLCRKKKYNLYIEYGTGKGGYWCWVMVKNSGRWKVITAVCKKTRPEAIDKTLKKLKKK